MHARMAPSSLLPAQAAGWRAWCALSRKPFGFSSVSLLLFLLVLLLTSNCSYADEDALLAAPVVHVASGSSLASRTTPAFATPLFHAHSDKLLGYFPFDGTVENAASSLYASFSEEAPSYSAISPPISYLNSSVAGGTAATFAGGVFGLAAHLYGSNIVNSSVRCDAAEQPGLTLGAWVWPDWQSARVGVSILASASPRCSI